MVCELIAVGTEILLGQILNTNSRYLSQQLSGMGLDLYYQTVVGDNFERCTKTLSDALDRSDVVLLTGGLGPTEDDITKEVVAQNFGLEMELHQPTKQRLEDFFKSRNREMTPNNLRQAYFPNGSRILDNPHGTAPGCIVEQGGKIVAVMPGPPMEMQPMFENHVRPCLEARSGFTIASRMLRIIGMGESAVEHAIRHLLKEKTNPTIAPYASLGEVSLRITAKLARGEDPNALLDPCEAAIRKEVGDYIYCVDQSGMDEVVADLLMGSGKRVGVAESCTGGAIAQKLTAFPGISKSFIEGIVSYSNESKIRRLNVSEASLKEHGAVSEQVALEMARGLFESGGVDFAVGVTGIAGPDGGSDAKPVGLVYIALVDGDYQTVHDFHLFGDRQRVQYVSTLYALDIMRKYLVGKRD